MDKGTYTFNLLLTMTHVPTVLLALVYSVPIVFIRRFQRRHSIFTVNVCLAVVLLGVSSFVHFMWIAIDPSYTPQMPMFRCLNSLRALAGTSLPLAIVVVPCHRCISIVYSDTRFFRTKQWITVCIVCQWIAAAGLALLDIIYVSRVRDFRLRLHMSDRRLFRKANYSGLDSISCAVRRSFPASCALARMRFSASVPARRRDVLKQPRSRMEVNDDGSAVATSICCSIWS